MGILRLMVMSKLCAENKSSECDGFPSSDGVLFPPAKGLAAIRVSTPGSCRQRGVGGGGVKERVLDTEIKSHGK